MPRVWQLVLFLHLVYIRAIDAGNMQVYSTALNASSRS